MGYKIREAQMQKIPYQIVVGDKEVENNEVNVRQYGSQDQETLEKDEFIWNLVDEIRLKNIDNLEKIGRIMYITDE